MQRVNVTYAVDGELARVRGKAVIVAAGGWIARHIVRDLPPSYVAAYAQFHHGPILVANVAVRNWQAFAKLGISAAHWFDGFGFFVNIRQPMRIDGAPVPLDPSKPAMLTFYIGFPQPGVPIDLQTSAARAGCSVRATLTSSCRSASSCSRCSAFGIQCPARHRRSRPQPLGSRVYRAAARVLLRNGGRAAPLEVVRERYGRIAFGHSELSGRQSWASRAGIATCTEAGARGVG